MRRDVTTLFAGKQHSGVPQPLHQPPHYTPDYPESEAKKPLQDPYNEQLREPHRPQDTRLQAYKQRAKILDPEYNLLYGSTKTDGGWRYVIDNNAVGTVTTAANTAVTATVTLALAPHLAISRWPGAINAYLVIRQFSMSAQSAITTVGSIKVVYQDQIGGQQIPLACFVSNSSLNQGMTTLIPTPITDPDITAVGQLTVTLTGTTPTTSVYDWQLSFSYAYLLPCLEGYTQESINEVLKGTTDAPSYVKHA